MLTYIKANNEGRSAPEYDSTWITFGGGSAAGEEETAYYGMKGEDVAGYKSVFRKIG